MMLKMIIMTMIMYNKTSRYTNSDVNKFKDFNSSNLGV